MASSIAVTSDKHRLVKNSSSCSTSTKNASASTSGIRSYSDSTGQDLEDSGVHLDDSTHQVFSSYYDSDICFESPKSAPVSAGLITERSIFQRHDSTMEPVVEKPTTRCPVSQDNFSNSRTSTDTFMSFTNFSSRQELLLVPRADPEVVSETTEYSIGSDSESAGDHAGVSFLSAPETTMPVKKPFRESRGKMRFKKFFEPLRRSQSAGNTKDTPSPKLNYPHYHKHEQDEEDQESVDTGRGSMEPVCDQEEKSFNFSKAPKKKKVPTATLR